jgi:hypothetical protein
MFPLQHVAERPVLVGLERRRIDEANQMLVYRIRAPPILVGWSRE